ncbi:MAG: arginine--tRNA ligase [Candidatus Hodarchaeales archaeon]|jgi:arginyl-tRNA synthetase
MDFQLEVMQILSEIIDFSKDEINSLLETPPNEELGDLAFPCFTLSKVFKNHPNAIALDLQSKIKLSDVSVISEVKAVGPYLNFFHNPIKLTKQTLEEISSKKELYGYKDRNNKSVVVEYCSPNTNKPLHLGHLRNLAIGESVSRMLETQGYTVARVCLNNNRGIHISKSMLAYKKWGENKEPDKKSDHFVGDFYVLFSKESERDDNLEAEATNLLQKWESGDRETIQLWEKMNKWALEGFNETYTRFGIKFDRFFDESMYYNKGKEIVYKGLKNGIFTKDESGAIIADLGKKLGKKILLRGDDTSIYITQDLYLAKLKYDYYKFDKFKSIYVVANEQNYHFEVLFKLLDILKFDHLIGYHLNYGMVYLPEGRMKSREGIIVDADDLMDKLKKLAKHEIDSRRSILEERYEIISEKIALGAIKYYLLKFSPKKDFTFNPDESISFEGETGPYLQYSYVRAIKILSKATISVPVAKDVNFKELKEKNELSLVKLLYKFPKILEYSSEQYSPNQIALYTFKLAAAFNSFYVKCKVITEELEIQKIRLLLVYCFSIVLKSCMKLLCLDTVSEM